MRTNRNRLTACALMAGSQPAVVLTPVRDGWVAACLPVHFPRVMQEREDACGSSAGVRQTGSRLDTPASTHTNAKSCGATVHPPDTETVAFWKCGFLKCKCRVDYRVSQGVAVLKILNHTGYRQIEQLGANANHLKAE